jgi:copper homeostasis protein
MVLEVCSESLEGAITAAENGADRIELNSALKLGGLTPSLGLVKAVKREIDLPVIAILRPREGGFYYSFREYSTMIQNVYELIDAGVDGIALGLLNEVNQVDVERCRQIVSLSKTIDWVFHRAFDDIEDRSEALDELIEIGFKRVLTSGGCKFALEGIKEIIKLRERAGNKIAIMPGSGINSRNVKYILEMTGCNEVHASLSEQTITDRNSLFGALVSKINPEEVRKMRNVLDVVKPA